MFDLKQYEAQIQKCSHCKFCNATCPVFLSDLLETHVARARVELIAAGLLEHKLSVTRRFKEVVDRCLLCTNCVQTCPAAIPVDEIVISARYRLYHGRRENFFKRKILRRFMARRGFGPLLKMFLPLAKQRGFLPKEFPLPAKKSFADRPAGVISPAQGKTRSRVIYFVGCATNSLCPETAADVIKVYNLNGIEVVVPEGISCCGLPALAEGDLLTAQKMARHNLGLLKAAEADAIITDCTSCGMMLKVKALKLIPEGDPQLGEAVAVAAKTWEATDYLLKLGLVAGPPAVSENYTYHVPCHRGWTPTLNQAPRLILGHLPGAKLIEMEYPERCCGAGGAFYLNHARLSRNIGAPKIEDIAKTGAKTVLSQCPACRTFLQANLPGLSILHPLSFLARAYGGY